MKVNGWSAGTPNLGGRDACRTTPRDWACSMRESKWTPVTTGCFGTLDAADRNSVRVKVTGRSVHGSVQVGPVLSDRLVSGTRLVLLRGSRLGALLDEIRREALELQCLGGVEHRAAIEVCSVDVDAVAERERDGLKHERLTLSTLDRHPRLAAAAHPNRGHHCRRRLVLMLVRFATPAVDDAIALVDEARIGATLDEQAHHRRLCEAGSEPERRRPNQFGLEVEVARLTPRRRPVLE